MHTQPLSQDGKRAWHPFLIVLFFSQFFLNSCGQGYKDLSTANGRQIVLDEANNFLTDGQCQQAIDVLSPLYNSIYVDDDVRLVYASAYACLGGFNFPSLITGLTNASGGDIWSALIKSNYSSVDTTTQSHVYFFQTAATALRNTGGGSFDASDRPEGANLYMVFLQAEIIAKTIMQNGVGKADAVTGKKTVAITGLGSNQQLCDLEVAIATISDSLLNVSTNSALDNVSSSVSTACGGACPTNKDPSVCSAVEQAQGAALMIALDSQWSF